MKKSRFTESQRLAVLSQHDSGQSIDEICRAHQISAATFYNWKKDLAIEQDEGKRRLKHLEQENSRLKKMYSELMIRHEILTEGYEVAKKISAQSKRKN